MVFRDGRNQLATLIRRLTAGLITNDRFDYAAAGLLESDRAAQDPVLHEVYEAAWGLYHDLWTYRLRGRHAISKRTRREVARWLLFLYSDLEYEWRTAEGDGPGFLVDLLTLGAASRRWRREVEARSDARGHSDVWPFLRRSEFERCRSRPRFLCGPLVLKGATDERRSE